nr:hypothetical protein CFP56_67707 [Quercus suber]
MALLICERTRTSDAIGLLDVSSSASPASYQTAVTNFESSSVNTDMVEGEKEGTSRGVSGRGCPEIPGAVKGRMTEAGEEEECADGVRDDVPAEVKAYYVFVLGHPSEQGDGALEEERRPLEVSSTEPTEGFLHPSPAFSFDSCDINQSSLGHDRRSPKTAPTGKSGGIASEHRTDLRNTSLEHWRAAYNLRRAPDEILFPASTLRDGSFSPWEHVVRSDLLPSPLRIRKAQSSNAVLYGRAVSPDAESIQYESEEDARSRMSESTINLCSLDLELAPLTRFNDPQPSIACPEPQNHQKTSWITRLKAMVLGNSLARVGTCVNPGNDPSVRNSKPQQGRKDSAVNMMRQRLSSLGDLRVRFTKCRRLEAPSVVDSANGVSSEHPAYGPSACGSAAVSPTELRSALHALQDEMEGGGSWNRCDELLEDGCGQLTPSSYEESVAEIETGGSVEDVVLPLRVVNV